MNATTIPDFRGQVSLCTALICTSLTDDEATARINRENPTGISSAWSVADHFREGEANGQPCDESPETHRHLLFICRPPLARLLLSGQPNPLENRP